MIAGAPPLARRLQLRLPDRMSVNVLDEDGRAERRTVVNARAAVGVATGSDFEIEGAVHLRFQVDDGAMLYEIANGGYDENSWNEITMSSPCPLRFRGYAPDALPLRRRFYGWFFGLVVIL